MDIPAPLQRRTGRGTSAASGLRSGRAWGGPAAEGVGGGWEGGEEGMSGCRDTLKELAGMEENE